MAEEQGYQSEFNFPPEQMVKIRNMLKAGNLTFFYYPNAYIKNLVLQGTHPVAIKFPDNIKIGILNNNTITLSDTIVIQFLEKTLEEPWKFMLSNGEIRVKEETGIGFETSSEKEK